MQHVRKRRPEHFLRGHRRCKCFQSPSKKISSQQSNVAFQSPSPCERLCLRPRRPEPVDGVSLVQGGWRWPQKCPAPLTGDVGPGLGSCLKAGGCGRPDPSLWVQRKRWGRGGRSGGADGSRAEEGCELGLGGPGRDLGCALPGAGLTRKLTAPASSSGEIRKALPKAMG